MTVTKGGSVKGHGYTINAQAENDSAEILLYSEIGQSFWFDTIDAKTFVEELDKLDVGNILLRINSPGGAVFDGVAMYNALLHHRARVTSVIEGFAASIASIVMLAGDEVQVSHNAMVMIHNPWTFAGGDAAELRHTAGVLDKIRGTLIDTYHRKTGQSVEEIGAALDEERWFNAAEAVDFGLADSIVGEEVDTGKARAMATFDARILARFKNAPAAAAALMRDPSDSGADRLPIEIPQMMTPREAEPMQSSGNGETDRADTIRQKASREDIERVAGLLLPT